MFLAPSSESRRQAQLYHSQSCKEAERCPEGALYIICEGYKEKEEETCLFIYLIC